MRVRWILTLFTFFLWWIDFSEISVCLKTNDSVFLWLVVSFFVWSSWTLGHLHPILTTWSSPPTFVVESSNNFKTNVCYKEFFVDYCSNFNSPYIFSFWLWYWGERLLSSEWPFQLYPSASVKREITRRGKRFYLRMWITRSALLLSNFVILACPISLMIASPRQNCSLRTLRELSFYYFCPCYTSNNNHRFRSPQSIPIRQKASMAWGARHHRPSFHLP